ncbi:unnamed protein product [Angiostrongylus costaricensis]|uniref:Uncharacterized protein n=1 Tax=Angiostrongylus costaricensis TaxID=334426 RepID=A0A0R3PWE2_ANGCS|nr:unnamed protein product [Angiostrongylus costaricensis]
MKLLLICGLSGRVLKLSKVSLRTKVIHTVVFWLTLFRSPSPSSSTNFSLVVPQQVVFQLIFYSLSFIYLYILFQCQVVSERQKLMADQIKIRRRQRKDSIMNLQRDQLTSTISAAAALSGQMNFGLGGLSLLCDLSFFPSIPSSKNIIGFIFNVLVILSPSPSDTLPRITSVVLTDWIERHV